MGCGLEYCIYCENRKCILDFVDMDDAGMCTSRILIDVPQEDVARYRKEKRLEIERQLD